MHIIQNFTDLVFDPFRIGLLLALLLTMRRTLATTGVWVPLTAGMIFVALLIPMTLTPPADDEMLPAVLLGLLANILILGLIWLAYALWQATRRT